MLKISKTVVERASYWVPTLSAYGGCATLGLLYFTDWKAVLQYVPVWNLKYKTEK